MKLFEISNLSFFLGFLAYLIWKKEYRKISTLLTGSIFGVTLEFVNVLVFKTYYYNKGFFLQVGGDYNIPIIIGLAWGMLLVSSQELTKNYPMPTGVKALFEAIFVVSVDLFLDVVAVRLDGGFWTWVDIPLTDGITPVSIIGIPWGNYFGWFCVVFYSSLVLHIFDHRVPKDSWKTLLIRTFGGVFLAEICLFLSLIFAGLFMLLNAIWLLFLVVYFGGAIFIGIYAKRKGFSLTSKLDSWFPFIYFLNSYIYCLVAFILLDLFSETLWYSILLLLYMAGSLLYLFYRAYRRKA